VCSREANAEEHGEQAGKGEGEIHVAGAHGQPDARKRKEVRDAGYAVASPHPELLSQGIERDAEEDPDADLHQPHGEVSGEDEHRPGAQDLAAAKIVAVEAPAAGRVQGDGTAALRPQGGLRGVIRHSVPSEGGEQRGSRQGDEARESDDEEESPPQRAALQLPAAGEPGEVAGQQCTPLLQARSAQTAHTRSEQRGAYQGHGQAKELQGKQQVEGRAAQPQAQGGRGTPAQGDGSPGQRPARQAVRGVERGENEELSDEEPDRKGRVELHPV